MITECSNEANGILKLNFKLEMFSMKDLNILRAHADEFLWASTMQLEDIIVELAKARDQLADKFKQKKNAWNEAYAQARDKFKAENPQEKKYPVTTLKRQADREVAALNDEVEDLLGSIGKFEALKEGVQERIRSQKILRGKGGEL